MSNPREIEKYPVLLFDAFRQAGETGTATIRAASPDAARSIRGLAYTLRRLLVASTLEWHRDLAAGVAKKKFYLDGPCIVIASPMHGIQSTAVLETPNAH